MYIYYILYTYYIYISFCMGLMAGALQLTLVKRTREITGDFKKLSWMDACSKGGLGRILRRFHNTSDIH